MNMNPAPAPIADPAAEIKAAFDEMKRITERPPVQPIYWVTPKQLAEMRADPEHPIRKMIGDDPAFRVNA